MAVPPPLASYNYSYGNTNEFNRQIQFSRTGNTPNTIRAQVFVFPIQQGANPISTLQGTAIKIDVNSSQQKFNAYVTKAQLIPIQPLAALNIDQQNNVLKSLGVSRSIEVENGANGQVVQLHIH